MSKTRLTIVMVLAVYPLVTALLYLLGPFTQNWEIWHRTLILTPLTVASIIFVIAPLVVCLLAIATPLCSIALVANISNGRILRDFQEMRVR